MTFRLDRETENPETCESYLVKHNFIAMTHAALTRVVVQTQQKQREDENLDDKLFIHVIGVVEDDIRMLRVGTHHYSQRYSTGCVIRIMHNNRRILLGVFFSDFYLLRQT